MWSIKKKKNTKGIVTPTGFAESKLIVGKSDILGQVAHWTVVLSPYIPDDLEILLSKVKKKLEEHPDFIAAQKENVGFLAFDWKDNMALENWLHALLDDIPEFQNLNLSKAEKEKGVKFGDEGRPAFVGHSMHWKVPEDHEVVDLDAIVMNMCRSIAVERES